MCIKKLYTTFSKMCLSSSSSFPYLMVWNHKVEVHGSLFSSRCIFLPTDGSILKMNLKSLNQNLGICSFLLLPWDLSQATLSFFRFSQSLFSVECALLLAMLRVSGGYHHQVWWFVRNIQYPGTLMAIIFYNERNQSKISKGRKQER